MLHIIKVLMRMESTMERLDYGSNSETTEKPSRSKQSSKRKWREIENIKEKHRLMQELKEIDPALEYHEQNLKEDL